MAQPTNTYSTYDAKGIREDLADVIYDVSPTETPFLTKSAKVKASNTLHEWQTDSLAAAATNYVIEGDEATNDASTATTRLSNYCQISDKVAVVTGTMEAVNKAGRDREMAYQLVKRGKELKRDIEKMLLDNNAYVAGNDSTARETAGVPAWLTTSTDAGTGGADPTTVGSTARTDGTQRGFTEDMLLDVHQSVWDAGGNPDTLYVGSFNKRVASGFTGVATKTKDVEDKRIIAAADVYVSDFGEVTIIPNRFMRSRDALLLQSDMWAVAYLRNMFTQDLAITGDTRKKQIICEFALEARNEAASGGIFDLTTS